MLLPAAAYANDGDAATLAAYLRARAADAAGLPLQASQGYATALAASPDDEIIAIRAYRQGLAAGDLALADRAAAVLAKSGVAPNDASILQLSGALAVGDLRGAGQAVDRIGGGSLDFLAPVMRGWLALASGEGDPVALLDAPGANPIGARYARSHRALLLLAQGKLDDGIAATRAALGVDQANLDLRLAAAARLADKGRRDTALALLTGGDPVLAAARARLGKDDGATTAAEGIALLLTQLASDIGADGGSSLGVALTRSALRLDPASDRARLVLARALAGSGAQPLALVALARVDRHGIFALTADAAAATIRGEMGDSAAALALAERRAAPADATADLLVDYANLLTAADRPAEAAASYARAIAAVRAGGDKVPWGLLLQHGATLEQAGRWAEAKPVLEAALAAAPDEPLVLNYLGYSQIERGENLAVAEARIAKASALRPDDGGITDSLGWAYYVRGDAARAVPVLQKAARAEPADPEINEHLGDALWAVGRRYEARYAWQAAQLYADPAATLRIARKIAEGVATAAR